MKRHVRMPHSGKIRELFRLSRKTKLTPAEDARHDRLYVWLTARGDRCAQAAQDVVEGSKRSYRLLSPRAAHFKLSRTLRAAKWTAAHFAQPTGRSKRTFFDCETLPSSVASDSNISDAVAIAMAVFNEGA